MEKELQKKCIENVVRYAAYLFAFILTPFVAAPIAELFSWYGYGRMTPFFTNIFTMLFWILEFIAILIVDYTLKRKEKRKECREEKQLTLEEVSELSVKEKTKKKGAPPLPLPNLFILTAIVALCVLFISAQIDFKVKPFYEIGEKVNGYEFWNKVSLITRNMVKCVWIVLLMRVALNFAEILFAKEEDKTRKKLWVWLSVILALLPFGVYDVVISNMSLAFALTYVCLFYPAFTAVYYFTEQRGIKAYLLIMFIYIF